VPTWKICLAQKKARRTPGAWAGKASQGYLDAKAEYDDLKAEILARFSGATAAELSQRNLLGKTLPRLEGVVVGMYARFHRTLGSAIEKETASGVYGLLSNMTHPTLYPARQLPRLVADDNHPDHLTANLRLDDVDLLRRQASAAVIVFYNTLVLITVHFAWRGPIFEELTKHIEATFPESLA
jgi:hypothetical protein